jgi:hypothetical protein
VGERVWLFSPRLEVADENVSATRLCERMRFVPTGNVSTMPPPRAHITEVELILRFREAAMGSESSSHAASVFIPPLELNAYRSAQVMHTGRTALLAA